MSIYVVWVSTLLTSSQRQAVKERLAGAFRIFAELGYDDGIAGHISVRDPINEKYVLEERVRGLSPLVPVGDLHSRPLTSQPDPQLTVPQRVLGESLCFAV